MVAVGATVAAGLIVTAPAQAGVSEPAPPSNPDTVPTPALLPGLIGMGIAALRQRQEKEREP
ncbi:MAG: PTPA-CTERM sorting domain-containing protein [Nodosilinea sp.]